MDVSKSNLNSLLDHLPGMVYRCLDDSSWTILLVSEGSHTLTGYASADWFDAHTVTFRRLIHPDDWDRIHREAMIAANGTPVQMMYRIITASGGEKWVLDHRSEIQQENGEHYYEGFIADATRSARLMNELEEYSLDFEQAIEERITELRRTKDHVEAILARSPDAILFLSPDGQINSGNPAAEALFGFAAGELTGRTLIGLVNPDEAYRLNTVINACREGDHEHRLELQGYRKNATAFDADLAIAPIWELNELTGIVCSIRNISSSKEIERLRDQFVANVSHELRTPITSMKLNFDLIERDPENLSRYIQRLGREITRLDTLIEDLLRLSRLDQGKVEMHFIPLDTNLLAAQYAEDRYPIAKARGLTLRFEPESNLPAAVADAGLLGQALSVLLTNAISYTPEGGTVIIRTHSANKAGQSWVGITVHDTGYGLSPEEVPHLFERFYRGRAGRRSQAPGTGLGLAIADQIARRHHGHIEVDPGGSPGVGASFTLWLPAR